MSGTLTIGQAALKITANNQGMTYGGTLPTLTASYTGLVNSDTPASLTTPPTLATVPASSHAGSYTITAGGAVDPDYSISYVSGTLTIGQAAVKITAKSKDMTYGGTLPTLTASYTGLVNGDTPASLSTLPTLATVPASSHAGSYAITAGEAVDPDYSISYVSGTLTIGQAALTITADNQGMTYGGTLPTLTASYTGLVNGDTPASLSTLPTLATAPASSHAGSYAITASAAVDPDYSISYVSGTLTIGQAALTITADNQGMTYGGTLPTLTASYAGLVNGDTPASLTTLPTLATVPASSHAGSYAITASAAVDPDYSISYVSGTLTIGQAALTITANNQGMTYGGTLPTLTASYTGLVNGDTPASLSTLPTLATVPASSHAGSYAITAGAAIDPDYSISYVSGTLTIGQAALTITADSQGMTYGGTLPALTASYTGLVNGDTPASLTTPPTLATVPASSHAGSYAITASAAIDPDYSISYVSRHADHRAGGLDHHRRQPGHDLRRHAAHAHGQLHGLGQWRHASQPDHAAHACHGSGQQPCRVLRHHRRGGGRSGLLHQLRQRHAHHRPGGLDHHRRQPGHDLRRHAAHAHGQLHGPGQRRHAGQPEHAAHACHGSGQQPCRVLCDHRQRARSIRTTPSATSAARSPSARRP